MKRKVNKKKESWEFDEFMFEEPEVFDITSGALGFLHVKMVQRRYGKSLKDILNKDTHELVEALNADLPERKVNRLFSPAVSKILNKVREMRMLGFLNSKEVSILFIDFIIPVSYGKNWLIHDSFSYYWVIQACRFIWNDTEEGIRKGLYEICCPNEKYEEFMLSEEEKIQYELAKYPELRKISFGFTMEESYKKLLSLKENVPKHLFAYQVKCVYKGNTRGATTETLHKVFENLAKSELMSSKDVKEYERLPEYITIYRGTDANEQEPRLSWTLERHIAEKFATGQLFSATIPKEKILAYFDTDEKEVLVWLEENEIKRKWTV